VGTCRHLKTGHFGDHRLCRVHTGSSADAEEFGQCLYAYREMIELKLSRSHSDCPLLRCDDI